MQADFDVGPWKVKAEPDATRDGYESWGPIALANACQCSSCQNFRAARTTVYPTEFVELLKMLGVDPRVEDDVNDFGPREATWYQDYERSRGPWQEWTWIYAGCFRAFGRVSGGPMPVRGTTKEGFEHVSIDKYEMEAERGFSYHLYPSDIYHQFGQGPATGSPFGEPNDTFVITFMAEEVPWLLESPPWEGHPRTDIPTE